MDEEDYHEPPPPSPEKVARRALILSAVVCRSMIDEKQEEWAKELSADLQIWLQGLDLAADLSDWEAQILATPFGYLSERDRRNGGWLSEGLTVLAWALGKCEMPAFDRQIEPSDVSASIGFMESRELSVLNSPVLLASSQLGDYNEFVYNVHWRVRSSRNRETYDFMSLAKKAWGEPLNRYGLSFLANDIALAGVPLPEAPESEVRNLTSITQERHRASIWLIGYASEDFYEVTTDT